MTRKLRKSFESKMIDDAKKISLKNRGSWGLREEDKGDYFSTMIAPYTVENFGEDCLTSQGLPDGDTGYRDGIFFFAGDAMVDIFGEDLSEKDFCCMDFAPDPEEIWSDEEDCSGVDFYRAPAWAGGRMSFYCNPHRKMKVRGKVVNRYY